MAVQTKYLLTEQALRRIKAGSPAVGSNVHHKEVEAAIMQAINALLRPRHFEALNIGEGSAESCVITTYENVPVTKVGDYSKCTLPATPVQLIRGQGVHRVYAADDLLDHAFIPCTSAEFEMLASQPEILGTVNGKIAYKIRGRELIFNKDLTGQSPAFNSVTIELVVMDFDQYSDYDPLPLDADMAAMVIDTVVKQFNPEPRPKPIDSTADTK